MQPVRYHKGKFPPKDIDWDRLLPLIGPAAAAVARYDGTLSAIPNPRIFLAPLTMREAVLSSRIEGTEATLSEVLGYEAGQAPVSVARKHEIQEVLNYRRAMRNAEEHLQELPLSQRVIKATHRILLAGVRGKGKAPGEYRRIPNWIGPPGCGMDQARFVPIDAQELTEAMGKWERYLHSNEPDLLVQLAILHAEFEALHPFLDGNGRLGRLLVPLILWQRGQISEPTFYVSAFFEQHRDEYYDGLLAVSRDGDWTGWCSFFLGAVQAQAEDNLTKAREILELYEKMKGRLAEIVRSRFAILALDAIFVNPVFSSRQFAAEVGCAESTSRRMLDALCEHNILTVISSGRGRRGSILAFGGLLEIVEGGSSI